MSNPFKGALVPVALDEDATVWGLNYNAGGLLPPMTAEQAAYAAIAINEYETLIRRVAYWKGKSGEISSCAAQWQDNYYRLSEKHKKPYG